MSTNRNTEATLEERGKRYGDFAGHAAITYALKNTAHGNKLTGITNWDALTHVQKEALDMIFHKIGRILNGDPFYSDSWHDIAGYAQLAEKEAIAVEADRKADSESQT